MEHENCKTSRQTTIEFRCEKILPDSGRLGDNPLATTKNMKVDEKQDSGYSLASPTPEKPIQPPRRIKSKIPFREETKSSEKVQNAAVDQLIVEGSKNSVDRDVSDSPIYEPSHNVDFQSLKESFIELPEKYKVIAKLFDQMVTSTRLLGLRKKLSSFQNISTQVEILAKRKFLVSHLAQIKYLFAEAIQIEKIFVHDGISLCMKPDMKITLLLDTVEYLRCPEQTSYMTLGQVFRARILDFSNVHPECIDIPEAMLPEPFNLCNARPSNQLPMGLSTQQLQPASVDPDLMLGASHLCPSFCRHFSQKIIPEKQMSQLFASPESLVSMGTCNENSEDIKIRQEIDSSSAYSSSKPHTELIFSTSGCTPAHLSENTPVKLVSTPGKLTIETPALPTPKRTTVASPDEKLVTETQVLSHSARRSLIYSPTKTDGSLEDPVVGRTDHDCHKISCSQDTATKRILFEEEITGYLASDPQMGGDIMPVKMMDHDHSKTGLGRRQQMLACLPDLFNTIRFIFRSINCSSITKHELVHKILSYNCEIEDTDEVEEQLQLLEELVPDWICGKIESSGDFLYRISNASDQNAVRARLVEAV